MHKGYQCLHSSGRVYINNHIIFYELSFPFKSGVDFSSISQTCIPTMSSSNSFSSQLPPQTVLQLDIPLSQSQLAATDDSCSLSQGPSIPHQSPIPANIQNDYQQQLSSPTSELHHLSPPPLLHTGHPMVTRSKNGIFKPKAYILKCQTLDTEPTSVSVALADAKWYKAMSEEYQVLLHNQT